MSYAKHPAHIAQIQQSDGEKPPCYRACEFQYQQHRQVRRNNPQNASPVKIAKVIRGLAAVHQNAGNQKSREHEKQKHSRQPNLLRLKKLLKPWMLRRYKYPPMRRKP
jgi:hypothetical protein